MSTDASRAMKTAGNKNRYCSVGQTLAKSAAQNVSGGLDLFSPDGFNAAQMIVRAVGQGGDDVEKMIEALAGWSFDGVKGHNTIRKEDHQAFIREFIYEIHEGKYRIVEVVPKEKTVFPPACKFASS